MAKPQEIDRIDWNHPAIQMTGMAPDYLVQELFGYSDSYWKQVWLKENRNLWEARNRRPWVFVRLLGRATSGNENESDHGTSGGDGA